jgi:hypothetical protein
MTSLEAPRPAVLLVTGGRLELSTMQEVGNAVAVAVTGVIFSGTLHPGYDRAFELSMLQLGCLLLAVAAASRLVPSRNGGQS